MDGEIITENRARLEARLRECAATLVDQKMPLPDRIDRVSYALSGIENEIRNCYDESEPGVRYVVRPGSALAPEGIIRRGTFLGCSEIEELVVDEGIVEMEDFWWEGLPRLRRLFLPASLRTLGGSIRDPVEEVVFAQGCKCSPYFHSSTLKRIVWPSGCESCGACTFGGGQNLAEVVGLEVLKCVDVDAFWGMEHCKLSLPDDFKLTRIRLNNDIPPLMRPFIARHRDRAMSLLSTVRDLSQPVSARVDAWLELTSSNLLIRALPDDVRDQALRAELPMFYKDRRPKWPDHAERLPKSASAGGQKAIAEMEKDNYSRAMIQLGADPDMKGAPLHFSWNDILDGLRRRLGREVS